MSLDYCLMNRLKRYLKSLDITALTVLSLLFITYSIVFPHYGHGWDLFCWKEWCKNIFLNGLGNVYKSSTDYLPLYHYILYFFGKLQGSIELIDKNIYFLRIITLAFDFTAGYLIYSLSKTRYQDKNKALVFSLFFFLNIAYFYNTLIWGQVDGIMACFILFCLYFSIKGRIILSLVFLILSINLKLQAIIFIPLIGIILLPSLIKNYTHTNLLKWLSVVCITQLIIIFPFILSGDIGKVWGVVRNSVGRYPVLSMNAYNFWVLLYPDSFFTTKDSMLFLGLTLKNWGLILFFIFSFFALLPLLFNLYKIIFKKSSLPFNQETIILTSALIPFIFFYFNTQMHERYLHPAILFLALYAIIYNKYLVYIFGSLAYILNLEDVLRYLNLNNYYIIYFKSWFISVLMLITIIILFYNLYSKFNNENKNYISQE